MTDRSGPVFRPCINPVFLVGTPRPETTLTAKILGDRPELFMPGETHFFNDIYTRQNTLGESKDTVARDHIANWLSDLYGGYYEAPDQEHVDWLFASEIKAILTAGIGSTGIVHNVVRAYLAFRYVPGPHMLFQGIIKLGPGHCALWEKGTLHQWRYYQPPDHDPCVRIGKPDDPVGTFLGGAGRFRSCAHGQRCAIRRLSLRRTRFARNRRPDGPAQYPAGEDAVGFREPDYSERPYARTTAKRFNTEHHKLTVSQDDLVAHLPVLVRFRNVPVAKPSDIPIYLLSTEAYKTAKMLLTDEGSDTLPGGYSTSTYSNSSFLIINARPHHCILTIEPLVYALPYRFRCTKTTIAGTTDGEGRMARWFGALSPSELHLSVLIQAARKAGSANSLAPRRATRIYVESGTSTRPAGCRTTCSNAAIAWP